MCGELGSLTPEVCSKTIDPSSRSSLIDNEIDFLLINELLDGADISNIGKTLSKTIFSTLVSGAWFPASSLPSKIISYF